MKSMPRSAASAYVTEHRCPVTFSPRRCAASHEGRQRGGHDEPWQARAISIDYRSGLITFQKEGIHTGYMKIFESVVRACQK